MGCRDLAVHGCWFRVPGFGLRCSGFKVDRNCKASVLRCRVQGLQKSVVFRVSGSGFRVDVLGLGWGFEQGFTFCFLPNTSSVHSKLEGFLTCRDHDLGLGFKF